jgi:putative transposase
MKRSRFTEEQIIAVLREQKAGLSTAEVCRKHGISTATLYAWRAKFGGMDVSEAKRLKPLEDENARLKRLLADAMLDNVALKDLLGKNSDARRQARGCRSFRSRLRDERAPGVPPDPGRSQDRALSIAPAAR